MVKSILIMIDGLGIGGAESHLISLLDVFDYNKYKVDLLMYRRYGALEKFVPEEVTILPIPGFFDIPPTTNGSRLNYLFSRVRFGIGRRINYLIGSPLHDSQIFWNSYNDCFDSLPGRYDFAVAFGQGFPCYYVADKVHAKKKLLSINVDLQSEGYRARFNYRYFSKYDCILPVTESLRHNLLKLYSSFSEKIYVFGNTFNIELMKSMAQTEKAFNDNFNGIRIVSVGRFVPAKRFDLAIKAAFILKEHKLFFKWYLIGDGHLRNEFEKLIKYLDLDEHVILTGNQLNPYKFLNEADIYVQTSKHEGFCRTIKEAKVFGLPIITTNFSVIHEQITNEINGLIVDLDEKEITRGIERLISNPELKQFLIENIKKEPQTTAKEEFGKFEKFLTTE